MYERFTDRARKSMQVANQEAVRFNQEYIGTEHILFALMKEECSATALLKDVGVDYRRVAIEVEKLAQAGPDMIVMGKLPQTPQAKKVIEYAIEEAWALHQDWVGTEHLLLGLLREEGGLAGQILMNSDVNIKETRKAVQVIHQSECADNERISLQEKREGWEQRKRFKRIKTILLQQSDLNTELLMLLAEMEK